MKAGIFIFFVKRALRDIQDNRLLHIITIVTIALSILIVSAFGLFFVNVNDLLESWKKGVRIIAYMDNSFQPIQIPEVKKKLTRIDGVATVRFVSKEEGLADMKARMKRQSAIFENLRENPLPDLFEIRLSPETQNWREVEILAARIETLNQVASVEYGQQWIGRISGVFNLFRFTGTAMSGVFFMASVFIVANTIRLLFYSKQEELEIMRLVGATDGFIQAPFYIEGILQGAIGGLCGLLMLYLAYVIVVSNIDTGLAGGFIDVRFLPFSLLMIIIGCAVFSGWLGCFLSLKQFLRK